MAVTVRAQAIERDVELLLSSTLSPEARSAMFAEFAREQIDEGVRINKQVLGRVPQYTVSVDGRMGAPLDSVRPDGYVIAEFEVLIDTLIWISRTLEQFSPVRSGAYRRSHTIFADGVEVELGGKLPVDVQEWVFINTVPYARKIEKGSSSQAPDGVYQATATLAKRFSNIAKIVFTYRTLLSAAGGSGVGTRRRSHGGSARAMAGGIASDQRTPAIIVTMRG